MENEEIWKPIPWTNGIYEVSNMARVRSLDRTEYMKNGRVRHRKGRILSPNKKASGYLGLHFSIGGKSIEASLHVLVAKIFVPNPDGLPCVNHKDRNQENNLPDNLEWCTYRYNTTYDGARDRAVASRGCRKVRKYSKDGVFLEEYRSGNDAAAKNGLSYGNLYSTLHGGQKTCGGFVWKYSDEN